MELIDKSKLLEELKRCEKICEDYMSSHKDAVSQGIANAKRAVCQHFIKFLDTLEVKDPYEQCVQHPSIKDGIEAHAKTYSFNIESELFPQLTKEQQALWRKEIEQACISGGDVGVTLARDQRYKENLEVQEDLDEELDFVKDAYYYFTSDERSSMKKVAKHFFELGIKAAQKENKL